MLKDKYPVNRGRENNLPVKEDFQKNLTRLFESYTERHSKTFFSFVTITYPQSYKASGGNEDMSKMMPKLVQKNKRKGNDLNYAWAREQETSHNPHYHATFLSNGHKVKSGYHLKQDLEALWGSTLKADVTGCVHICDKDKRGNNIPYGTMLDKSKPDFKKKFDEAHEHASYKTKEKGKGEPKDGIRDCGMSRLKK